MSNLIIGIICIVFSIFLLFLSPKEIKNILGYKSLQQGTNKNIWKWSNKCFGILAIVGSSVYLIISVILKLLSMSEYNSKINQYGLIYILISVIITEIYVYTRKHKE